MEKDIFKNVLLSLDITFLDFLWLCAYFCVFMWVFLYVGLFVVFNTWAGYKKTEKIKQIHEKFYSVTVFFSNSKCSRTFLRSSNLSVYMFDRNGIGKGDFLRCYSWWRFPYYPVLNLLVTSVWLSMFFLDFANYRCCHPS